MFGLAEMHFKEFGSVVPTLVGMTPGKRGVNQLPLGDAWRETIAYDTQRIMQKFGMAVFMAESWTAPGGARFAPDEHPERKEVVSVFIHTPGCVYAMSNPIARSPDRLIKGEVVALAGLMGRLVDRDKPLTDLEASAAAKELRQLLRAQHKFWKAPALLVLNRLISAHRFQPIYEIYNDATLPADSLAYLRAIVEAGCELLTTELQDGSLETTWLAAAVIETDLGQAETFGLALDAFTDAANEQLAAVPGAEVKVLFPHFAAPLFYPIEELRLRSVLVESERLANGEHGDCGPAVADLADAMERYFASLAMHPTEIVAEGIMLVLLRVDVVLPGKPTGENEVQRAKLETLHPPQYLAALESASAPLEAACEQASLSGCPLKLLGVKPVFEAMRELRSRRRIEEFRDFLQRAADPTIGPTRVQLTTSFAKDSKQHLHMGVLWDAHGKFLSAAWGYGFYGEPFPEPLESIARMLTAGGVTQVEIYPQRLVADTQPMDPQSGALLLPDFAGGWFNTDEVIAPGSLDIVRRLHWYFTRNGLEDDPLVQRLPAPHLQLRLGLLETMSSHYSLRFYRVLKDALADTHLDSEGMWALLREKFPAITAAEAAVPGSVRPNALYEYTLRLHWSKSSTLKVRSTLIERLKDTHINLELPADLFRGPFGFCYIHFERRLDHVQWQVADTEEESAGTGGVSREAAPSHGAAAQETPAQRLVELEGAFVHTVQRPAGRRLVMLLVGRGVDDWKLNVTQSIVLDVADEQVPVNRYLAAFAAEHGMTSETLDQLRPAIEEIAKVLVYLGLKEARTVSSPERTLVMRGATGKPAEKQEKIRHKTRGLYDHILVGPEKAPPVFDGRGLSGRRMPVHQRRAFMNYFWTGKGRTVVRARWIDEVVVNKRLLGDGESPPPPKDYHLR